MDKNERARLRELLEKATPGPWHHDADDSASIQTDLADVERLDEENGNDMICSASCANAELITSARNALPSLLDALDAAERERDAAVMAEREACAKVAEAKSGMPGYGRGRPGIPLGYSLAMEIANAIRARSK